MQILIVTEAKTPCAEKTRLHVARSAWNDSDGNRNYVKQKPCLSQTCQDGGFPLHFTPDFPISICK